MDFKKVIWPDIIYIYRYIEGRLLCSLSEFLEVGHPPTIHFSQRNRDDKGKYFQKYIGFLEVLPRQPLQKIGQRGGCTEKLHELGNIEPVSKQVPIVVC